MGDYVGEGEMIRSRPTAGDCPTGKDAMQLVMGFKIRGVGGFWGRGYMGATVFAFDTKLPPHAGEFYR